MVPGLPSRGLSLRFNLLPEVITMESDPSSRMRPGKEAVENRVSA